MSWAIWFSLPVYFWLQWFCSDKPLVIFFAWVLGCVAGMFVGYAFYKIVNGEVRS